jgi:hypothetical protein
MKSKITWRTVKSLVKQAFAPVGEPAPPDHPPRWVLRDGVPDLCCDQHRPHSTRAMSLTSAPYRLRNQEALRQ